MDALYRAYSSPMELISRYSQSGRFGTFVEGFILAEHERKKAEAEHENERMLWAAYIHSYSDKTFSEWKKEAMPGPSGTRKGSDGELTDEGISHIMKGLFPSKASPGK